MSGSGVRRNPLNFCVLLLALLATRGAAAQDGGFSIQQFHPTPSQWTGFWTLDSGWILTPGSWEVGLLFNHADDPLVLVDANGERIQSVVGSQSVLNLVGAVGIHERFELGLDIPLIVAQSGDPFGVASLDASGAAFGIGDIRIVPRFQIIGKRMADTRGIGLSASLDTSLPTGKDEDFQGEGFRVEPRLLLEWSNAQRFRVGIGLGYAIRPAAELVNVEVDDTFTWALAGGVPIAPIADVLLELHGEVSVLADDLNVSEAPTELLAGVQLRPIDGLQVRAALGTGLADGFGSPDWRLVLGASYGHMVAPESDRDGDGYPDSRDSCPDDPEDFDDFEDSDGCPEPDNDQDGILDRDDDCPNDPEDIDEFEDEDGCPDPDNDRDLVLDVDDQCPLDPEDIDMWEDEDGCPDPDNDEDGILDEVDDCPNSPESFNGFEDEDGCWDEELVVVRPCESLSIDGRVFFDSNSDVIQQRSHDLLDQVARMLVARQEIRRMRIEGHTDSRGSDEHNLDLSRRRAASVRRYLIDFGVWHERLISEGLGEEEPIADNGTDEGRQLNRRVEFIILEQEGCEDQQE